MLICPSAVGNSPVGMPVGWSLPACFATSPAISQREAWKSSMKICASSSEVCTHCPSPDCSRSISAIRIACASRMPAHRSSIGMPTRTGPCPGKPVIDIRPAHALRDLIDPGPLRIRPGLAEAGDAAIDDALVDLLDGFVIDAEAELHLGAEILDDHIGLLGQLHKDRLAVRAFQVEREAALVAVQVLEIEPFAARAGDVVGGAAGRLDLDDLGAPIGELAHRGRSGAGMRQVEHGEAGKRQGSDAHVRFPPDATGSMRQACRTFRAAGAPRQECVARYFRRNAVTCSAKSSGCSISGWWPAAAICSKRAPGISPA